jgi:hypothetical protein
MGVWAYVLGLACVLGFVAYSFWPALNSWWYIIDDHYKAYLLTSFNGLSLKDICIHFYHAPDFQALGQGPRVQPMLHFLMELELYVFGLHPLPWYFCRILGALLFAGFSFVVLAKYFKPVAATLLTLAILIPGYQSQVFLRLGVSEAYMAPSMAIAFWIALQPEARSRCVSILLAIVYAVCIATAVGTKEVMVVFMPLIFLQVVMDYLQNGLRSPRLYGGIFGLLFSLFILVCLYFGLRNLTTDIYGRSLSFGPRLLQLTRDGWLIKAPVLIIAPAALLAWAQCWKLHRKQSQMPVRFCLLPLFIMAGLAAAYLGSVFFYNCDIPRGTHYEFPVTLLSTCGLFLVIALAMRFVAECWVFVKKYAAVFYSAAGLLCLVLTLQTNPVQQLRANATDIRDNTQAFRDKLNKLISDARAKPDLPIEFVSFGFNDFEPVSSVQRFLRAFGVQNKMVLNVHNLVEQKPMSQHDAFLKSLMMAYPPQRPDGFDAVTRDVPSTTALRIHFSNQDLSDGAIANFWPLR